MKKLALALLFVSSLLSCQDESENNQLSPPDTGLYASSQFGEAQLTRYNDIAYSTRQNYEGMQFTDRKTKAAEREMAQLTMHLDIAVPPNATASSPQPLLIFVHGGGFITGSKDDGWDNMLSYATAGYVAATINYRLTAKNNENSAIRTLAVSHAVEDAMNAIRFLKAPAGTYHIDTTRIATVGGSAGGGITLTNAIAADELPQFVTDFPAYRSKVQASVATGATLSGDSLVDNSILVYDASDSPVLLFHNSVQDPITKATWGDVLTTQKNINDSGNECIVVPQPPDTHTVNLKVDGPYWEELKSFLWDHLRLYEKQ